MASNDGFEVQRPKQKKSRHDRIYISNISATTDAKEKLLRHLETLLGDHIDPSDVEMSKGYAFLSIPSQTFHVTVSKINESGLLLDGKKLRASKEKNSKKRSNKGFGGSWTKPTTASEEVKDSTITTTEKSQQKESLITGNTTAASDVTTKDFAVRQKNSLSALLKEYGDFDPNWKSLVPTEGRRVSTKSNLDSTKKSLLMPHGKAPIHVVFYSFGHVHGAPKTSRTALNYSSPFPPVDCRSLSRVDPSQEHLDGRTGSVKKYLMSAGAPNVTSVANSIAKQTELALLQAMEDGHGYANNLCMTISIGSHFGRHRAVVVAELAATNLRQRLRENIENKLTQPCSVGTLHRDIDRRKAMKTSALLLAKDKIDAEDDW